MGALGLEHKREALSPPSILLFASLPTSQAVARGHLVNSWTQPRLFHEAFFLYTSSLDLVGWCRVCSLRSGGSQLTTSGGRLSDEADGTEEWREHWGHLAWRCHGMSLHEDKYNELSRASLFYRDLEYMWCHKWLTVYGVGHAKPLRPTSTTCSVGSFSRRTPKCLPASYKERPNVNTCTSTKGVVLILHLHSRLKNS